MSAICVMAYGKKINDENVSSFCRDANQAISVAGTDTEKSAAFEAEAAKWFKSADLEQITPAQVDFFFVTGGMTLDKYMRRWLEPTLVAKSAKDAAFSFLAWKYMPENDGFIHSAKEIDMLKQFLESPKLQGVLEQQPSYAQDVFASLSTMKDANWNTEGFPEAIIRFLDCNMSELAVLDCVNAFNSIARVDNISDKYREAVRVACVNKYKNLLKSLDNARKQKTCNERIKYLEGPFACGTLVGGKAPELHIIRAFKQQGDSVAVVDVKSLDDLRGKVVMLDFWGTKCVPCIQSFPEIAELQKHFEGKDVVILGVTSLQGFFVDTPNHRTIQCRNNPEKELGCFPGFMKAMGINWHIAITEENVMNTDFGVLAIPHVTVIDKQGKVRYNALNLDNEGKVKIIETLLGE